MSTMPGGTDGTVWGVIACTHITRLVTVTWTQFVQPPDQLVVVWMVQDTLVCAFVQVMVPFVETEVIRVPGEPRRRKKRTSAAPFSKSAVNISPITISFFISASSRKAQNLRVLQRVCNTNAIHYSLRACRNDST